MFALHFVTHKTSVIVTELLPFLKVVLPTYLHGLISYFKRPLVTETLLYTIRNLHLVLTETWLIKQFQFHEDS